MPPRGGITRIDARSARSPGHDDGMVPPPCQRVALGFLWRIDSPDWEPRAARMLDLVMDGLAAGAPGP